MIYFLAAAAAILYIFLFKLTLVFSANNTIDGVIQVNNNKNKI